MDQIHQLLSRIREKANRWQNPHLYLRVSSYLHRLTLSQRFMLASLIILMIGMIGIGTWVESQIEHGVINTTGATTALYVDSFVSPLLQNLNETDQLQLQQIETLNEILVNTPIGNHLIAFRIWNPRGRLLYNSFDAALAGKSYPMSDRLLRARLGEVVSQISSLDNEENIALGALHEKLLETYSPIFLSGTNQVVAVAEFYQLTDDMDHEIGILKRRSWFVVGASILIVYLLLSGFVRTGSRIISRQQSELEQRMAQLSGVLDQNRELGDRIRRAAASVAQLNESFLRRIGSELHDGPVQYLSLSLLKLDVLAGKVQSNPEEQIREKITNDLVEIESTLQSALKEMRAIASGLSLPQLSDLDLAETVIRVVRVHERQTSTRVELSLKDIPEDVALPVKITIYRLIQEALNNAFRHADGKGQQVSVSSENEEVLVDIIDTGPGFVLQEAEQKDVHLGLAGMRERVESLGGRFDVETRIGGGTRITAHLPYILLEEIK